MPISVDDIVNRAVMKWHGVHQRAESAAPPSDTASSNTSASTTTRASSSTRRARATRDPEPDGGADGTSGAVAPRAVEDPADPGEQALGGERLLDEREAGVARPAADHVVVGIARHVDHGEAGA